MQKVTIDEVDPDPFDEDVHTDRRGLSDPLDTTGVAITRYVLDPGERFSGAVHAHTDQEEVFLVLEGRATFETGEGEDGEGEVTDGEGEVTDGESEVVVGEGEAIRFAPGEFQTGYNDGDEAVVAFALGAPRETEDVRIARIPVLGDREVECPDCGRGDMRIPGEKESGLVCPDCGGTLEVE